MQRYRPEVLASLRDKYPAAALKLSSGKKLGHAIQGIEAIPTDALETLAQESLAIVRENGKIAASELENKLRKARRLRLAGNLTGGGAAAGVVGAVALGQYLASLIGSVVVIVSSALSLMAEYAEGISGGIENRHVLRHKMVELMVSSTELEGEIRMLKVNPAPREACLEIVRRCNAAAADLRRIEFELGHH